MHFVLDPSASPRSVFRASRDQEFDPLRHLRAAARRCHVKLSRAKPIQVPEGICLQCFNSQQRFTFPFLVYCPHAELLALVRAVDDNVTFPCKPAQLASVIAKLSNIKGSTDAVPPASDGL